LEERLGEIIDELKKSVSNIDEAKGMDVMCLYRNEFHAILAVLIKVCQTSPAAKDIVKVKVFPVDADEFANYLVAC
jgi:hypothetical protein